MFFIFKKGGKPTVLIGGRCLPAGLFLDQTATPQKEDGDHDLISIGATRLLHFVLRVKMVNVSKSLFLNARA